MPVNNEVSPAGRKISLKIGTYTEFQEFSMKEIKEYEAKFKRFNVSGTGTLSLHELSILMQKLGAPQTHFGLKSMIEEVDEDKDGMISFPEFMMIFRRDLLGKLVKGSALEYLAKHFKLDAAEVGVEGAKSFFEGKIAAIRKCSKVEVENDFRVEHQEKKKEIEEKKERKKSFKQLTTQFETQ